METETKSEAQKTFEAAQEQLRFAYTALDSLIDLNETGFYPNDHYRTDINHIRNDISALESFLAV
ncbi:hypothetical protein LCGC14_0946170 [marine sediment metagenome]|uniref:Uncharacterized protein n=1 Tax=marine sediment metagenome TaxID=412755 RepID=A0A0F9R284_9ZZZZ